MARRMFIEVQGQRHRWSFTFYGDPAQIEEWRADGLRVFVIEYAIPDWIVGAGLMRPWVAATDALRWLRRAIGGRVTA